MVDAPGRAHPVIVYRGRYAVLEGGELVRRVAGASTIRGRAIKVGGVATQPAGYAGRTSPQTNATRPAYTIQAGFRKPTGGAGFATNAGRSNLFDPTSVAFWRLVAVALAVAYVVGFHVSLNGVRLGLGPGR
jgi:hypothetical protein